MWCPSVLCSIRSAHFLGRPQAQNPKKSHFILQEKEGREEKIGEMATRSRYLCGCTGQTPPCLLSPAIWWGENYYCCSSSRSRGEGGNSCGCISWGKIRWWCGEENPRAEERVWPEIRRTASCTRRCGQKQKKSLGAEARLGGVSRGGSPLRPSSTQRPLMAAAPLYTYYIKKPRIRGHAAGYANYWVTAGCLAPVVTSSGKEKSSSCSILYYKRT